jgi:hypothetical protein
VKREYWGYFFVGAFVGLAIMSFYIARDIHLRAVSSHPRVPVTARMISAVTPVSTTPPAVMTGNLFARPRWTEVIQTISLISLLPLAMSILFVGTVQSKMFREHARMMSLHSGILDAGLRETRRASESVRDIFTATERPWVSVSTAEITEGLVYDQSGGRLTVQIVLKNVGQMTAIHCWIDAEICIWSSDTEKRRPNEIQDGLAKRDRAEPSQAKGYTLFPNQDLIESVGLTVPRAQFDTAQKHGDEEIHLWIVGCVNYASAAGRLFHQTGFIYKLERGDTERFRAKFETMPTNIVPGEGDIPAASLVLKPDPLGAFAI